MNNIYKKQNDEYYIRLIRAFNAVYNKAKMLNAIRFFLSVVIPVGINISFILFEQPVVKSVLCFLVMLFMATSFILDEIIRHYVYIGSLIQQKFDLSLFNLGELTVYENEDIDTFLAKYSHKVIKNENNWYSDYSSLSEDMAVLYCQKENVSWTKRAMHRYLIIVASIVIVSFVPIILSFTIMNFDMVNIMQFFYNLIPVISFLAVSIYKTFEENNTLMVCDCYSKSVLENCSKNIAIRDNLIVLQKMIFEYRKTKRIIPGWLYWVFYKQDSAIEHKKADDMLNLYK